MHGLLIIWKYLRDEVSTEVPLLLDEKISIKKVRKLVATVLMMQDYTMTTLASMIALASNPYPTSCSD